MKNNAKKIAKLLVKFDRIFTECIEGVQRDTKKAKEKREKKLDRAEEIGRKALTLSREDIANGMSDCEERHINCVFRLSDLLIRRGHEDEAEGLLSEI